MITVNKHTKREYRLSEDFNELTLKQLLKIIPLIESGGDKSVVEMKCLQVLLSVSRLRYFFISPEVKVGLFPHIAWLFDKNTLTDQKLPEYKGYYGPQKEFDNLIVKEFHHAELYYDEIIQDDAGKERALNHLIAVLYRKPKTGYNKKLNPDGDIRRPFNANLVEYYSKQVEKWPMAVKLLIFNWYDGCRLHFKELYEPVFSAGKETGEPGEPGMFDFIRELARDGKYGDFDKAEALNLHTAFFEMEKTIEEAEEIKKLYPTS